MKKLLSTIFLFLLANAALAQTPKLINYQGVARGNDGAPVLNQSITLRFRILQGSITGSVAYTETQSITTNSLGLILTQIGLKADLGVLTWKNGPYFLEVAADMTGGSNVEVFGIQQVMGVPYAFHAATVPATYNATTNVLDVGGNTFTLSSTPQTTLTATGIASVQSLATNSFVVGVPTPSYTAAGPFTVSGTYPDYTLTAESTSITGTGNAVVTSSASNQFNVNVPFPQVSITSTAGTTGIGGSGTNSININIPAGVTPSITPFGVLTRTASGSNFSLSVPGTSVTGTGAASVSSSGTNTFAINVPPANVVLTATPGIAGLTSPGTNSFNINIPAASVALSSTAGAIGISSPGTNTFNINVPQTSVVVTSTAGAAGVSSAGTNSFSINVPPQVAPVISTVGVISRTVTGNNFTLSVPGTSVTASGAASVTSAGTNTFNVNVPQANVALTFTPGVAGVSSPGTNSFAINLPASNVALTSTAGAYAVSSPGTNSFNINVPATGIALTTTAGLAGISSSGTNSFNINVPATGIALTTTAGLAGISSSGTNSFNINVPATGIALTTTAGLAGISSTGTNSYNINVPTPTISPAGLANISSSGHSFTVNVPLLSYTPTTGGLGSGTNTLSIVQTLSLNNSILQSGPSSNSVNLASLAPWRQAVGAVTLTSSFDKVGMGGFAPTENLQVESPISTSVSILAGSTASADLSFGTTANHNLGRIRYDNSIGAMSLWTSGNRQVNIGSTGVVTIGSSTTAAVNTALVVSRAGAISNQILVTGGDASNSFGGMISFGENINPSVGMSIRLDASLNRLAFTNDLTGSQQVMSIGGYFGASNGVAIGTGYAPGTNAPSNGLIVEGFTGLGTNAPAAQMHVLGNSILQGNVSAIGNVSITGPLSTAGNVNIGTSAVAPSDLRVFGAVRMGTEAGTAQPPAYPAGSTGLIIRRIFSNNFPVVAGQVVASAGAVTFERDGTNGGFRVTRTGGTGQEVCHCTGVTNVGASLNKTFNNLIAGQTQIYTDLEGVVFMHCMFGDPFAGGHVSEISISRRQGDFWWVGNLTTTFNQ